MKQNKKHINPAHRNIRHATINYNKHRSVNTLTKFFTLIILVVLIGFVGLNLLRKYNNNSSSLADATTVGKYNVKLKKLGSKKTFRTWTSTNLYDLKTLRVVKSLPVGSNIGSNTLAYKNGGFFYLASSAKNKGRYHGVFISKVFEVRSGAKAVFAGSLVPIRNGMPLTNQKTNGGTCTARRLWHSGLNNNLVAAVQRVQLETGKHVPMNTAYRTYNEQLCLWNKLGQNPSKVARPGQSNHNRGLAIDVESSFANAYQDTFRKFKLCRPMSYEPWHFELCQ